MKVRHEDGDRLILSGPPGGVGAVVLLFVVGTAMFGGGALFFRGGLKNGETMLAVMGGSVGVIGLVILLGGAATAIARDRLELDRVTRRGQWTRRLLGRSIRAPIEFDFDQAKHVTVKYFVDSAPNIDRGGSTSIEKVRARLLVSKPRRAIVLDEAERQRTGRVQAIAEKVAAHLDLEVEGPD